MDLTPGNFVKVVAYGSIIIAIIALGITFDNMSDELTAIRTRAEATDAKAKALEEQILQYELQQKHHLQRLESHKKQLNRFKINTWRSFGHVRRNFLALKYGKDQIEDMECREPDAP